MLKKNLYGIFALVLFMAFSNIDAQPQHEKLLYHVPMTSAASNPIGEITSFGGEFSERGWTPKQNNGKLRVDLDSFLPFEGTLQVTLSGLMPTVNNEWIPIALYSRGSGSFYEVDPSPGSYIFLKTDERYAGNGLDFKFFSAAFYGANKSTSRKDTPIYARSWSPTKDYIFQIIWNAEKTWVMLDGKVLAVQAFKGQVESFGYIFLGSDNTYSSTMGGVYYKDLKIFVPSTDYPFSNIADPYAEMAHRKVGGQGVAIADVDNNGEEDIYISTFLGTYADLDNLLYVRNNSSFAEEGLQRGVNDPAYTYESIFGDFDNDGDNDLFVVNFHRANDYPNEPNHLYMNNGAGNFSNLTSNLSNNTAYDSKGATMLDIENDGDLDIVVINSTAQHQVYVNDGSGRFNVQTKGLENFRSTTQKYTGIVSGDLDKDGLQDLVIVHENGLSIAQNDKGYFRSRGDLSLAPTVNSASLVDIDRDADLDILVGMQAGSGGRIEIFRNNGNYSFANVSSEFGLAINTYGVVPGDWNNDSYIDLFAIEKDKSGKLYINDGAGRFTEKTYTGVEALFVDGRGVATFDVNDDGRLDIYAISRGGIAIDDATKEEKPYSRNYLFRNDIASAGNYLKIKMVDDHNNLIGYGYKIYMFKSGQLNNMSGFLGYREIMSTSGYDSQSSLVQHFGVGSASSVDLKIELPDGSTRTYTNVPTNQTLTVTPRRLVPTRIVRDFVETQSALAGEPYEVAYKLYTAENEPVPDHPVAFEIIQGNGSFDPQTTVTTKTVNSNQDGRAVLSWILGPLSGLSGVNQIRVTSSYEAAELIGSPDSFSVVAAAGFPRSITKAAGDNQLGFINVELTDELVARIVDKYGNGVASHAVEFIVVQGGGVVRSGSTTAATMTVTSDANGDARIRWILGSQLGLQKVEARATYQGAPLTDSPLTFSATAQEPQRKLLYTSGDGQSAPINTSLANPFIVRLLDSDNSPISGENVQFVATSGGHFAGEDSLDVKTDSQGYARATATVGNTVGDSIYIFKAYAYNALGSPVTFSASANSGPPTKMVYVDGNNQSAPAGRYLPNPLKVKLTDANDYPSKGYDVLFNVMEGNGKVNGLSAVTVQTDAQGIATVRWKLGEIAGANALVATASGLDLPGVNFKAQGVVGPAARLAKYSGDNQKGDAGQPLAHYFVVSVTDSFYNAVVNHPVTFIVTSGGGNFSGKTQLTLFTNAFGQAQTLLTMGPTVYEQTAQARSENLGVSLIGSPQTFYAYLGPGDPTDLDEISGNNQIGAVNQPLPEPFIVRVRDSNGIGVSNIDVEFVTFSQGASFAGSPSIVVRTDNDGVARARATLGSNFGNNNYVFEVIAKYNNKNLKGSPRQFYASGRRSLATKIQKLNGNELLVGTVGQIIGDSLSVLVLDEHNNPVGNHPVTFQIEAGLALINGTYTNHVALSKANGVASVAIKLGTRPGDSLIRASSDDGVNPLTPSFVEFNARALTGSASALTSTISAASGLIANGQEASTVEIVLLDEYRNPVIGKFVSLQAAGIDIIVNQPSSPTDDNGRTTGSISSINIGTVTIWALADNQPIVSTTVEFVPGPPVLAMKINDGQTGEKGTPLPQPVGVLLQDAFSHPIKNHRITFSVRRGKGSIAEAQPCLTNEEGRAMVHWTLGDSLGEQRLRAVIDDMITPLDFSSFAIPPSDGIVRVHSGDSLIAQANKPLPEQFKVSVTSKSGEPISSIPVEFQVLTQGGGAWSTTSRVYTGQDGIAAAQLIAGSQVGDHQVIATATNYGSVFFNYKILQQRSVGIIKLSADGQSVRPKTELPVTIKVVDAYNRPLNQEEIMFVQSHGQSYIKESLPMKTNAAGLLTATWVMGTSGAQQMEVRALNAANQPTTFTAVVVNSAPRFDPALPKNIATDAGQEVKFNVQATDPDGDDVYYIVRDLPSGASFDKDATRQFSWTPTTAQAGEHRVTFIIMDDFGASDSSQVTIVVDIRNQPPYITAYTPADTVKIVPFGSQLTFQVEAEDPNGDVALYEWTVNNAYAGDSNILLLVFTRDAFPDSFAVVRIRVYDSNGGQRFMTWRIHLQTITAVELVSFTAAVQNNTVRIEWHTAKEDNAAGFYVLRGRRKEGPFAALNEEIIKPRADGHYLLVDEDVQAGERYFYKLQEIDAYGMAAEHGLVEAHVALPTSLALRQNYPNPFNPRTTIQFELPAEHHISIAIFNTTGQLVRQLVDGEYTAGIHQVIWDADNEQGIKVPSGIYYYRMTTDGFNATKKLLLLK
ncbi:Ig-like domain-containing protein [candidate division KSB1 bacterium]|nr:Ig-like domain-containing protein [candidate division KSB1 bacterium]